MREGEIERLSKRNRNRKRNGVELNMIGNRKLNYYFNSFSTILLVKNDK